MENLEQPGRAAHESDEALQPMADALEATIAALQAEQRPPLTTQADGDVLALAAMLHGARPAAPGPDSVFLQRLGAQLEAQLAPAATPSPLSIKDERALRRPATPLRARGASRRALLTSGLAAAAGIAAGATVGVFTERQNQTQPGSGQWDTALVGMAGAWVAVAQVADIPLGGVQRFATPTIVGHLIHRSDGTFLALSAACTHMGCIVTWDGAARSFDCPCHNGRFDMTGEALPGQHIHYRPLPQLQTKVEAGVVSVFVPTTTSAAPTPAGTPTGGYTGHD